MNIIWIVCPTTGKDASTGIETDEESFSRLAGFTLTFTCPVCREDHSWQDMRGQLLEPQPKYLN
jgi:hypothetical protein